MFKLIISLLILYQPLKAGWLDRKAEGWAWYEKEKKQKEQEPKKPEKISQSQEIKQIREILEEKLASAILNPSAENILAYMQEQQKWIEQSAEFAKVWSKILLSHPELDPTSSKPVSQYGIQVHKAIENEKKQKLISALSKDYGLIFFFEGNNKVSQAFAPVVQEFSKRYSWNVMPITKDNLVVPEYTDAKQDNGIIEELEVSVYPCLFMINPKTSEAYPISYGLSSLDMIEKNILLQFDKQNEVDHE